MLTVLLKYIDGYKKTAMIGRVLGMLSSLVLDTPLCEHMCVCTYVPMYVHMYVYNSLCEHMCVFTYVPMYVHMYVCNYVPIYVKLSML